MGSKIQPGPRPRCQYCNRCMGEDTEDGTRGCLRLGFMCDRQRAPVKPPAPVRMRMWCPNCRARHVDHGEWATRPHRTHLCSGCGFKWRHQRHATVGVRTGETETGWREHGLSVDEDGNLDPAGLPQDVRDLGFTGWTSGSRAGALGFWVVITGHEVEVRGWGKATDEAYRAALHAARNSLAGPGNPDEV